MEMVYLVNGAESGGGSGGGGGGSPGYPMVKAVVTDGAVGLQDRSVTRVELKTGDAVRINFPPKTDGVALLPFRRARHFPSRREMKRRSPALSGSTSLHSRRPTMAYSS